MWLPGCLRSCMRTMETRCRCSTVAPNWCTGSRPTARSLPGLNTPKTSCRHCRAITAMPSQVCHTSPYRCTISLVCLTWLWIHTSRNTIKREPYGRAHSFNSNLICTFYFYSSLFFISTIPKFIISNPGLKKRSIGHPVVLKVPYCIRFQILNFHPRPWWRSFAQLVIKKKKSSRAYVFSRFLSFCQ